MGIRSERKAAADSAPLWRLQSHVEGREWDRGPRTVDAWRWNGQFLALLDGALPEPVLIDLEP